MGERRTKIVATLGPATDGDGMIEQLISAGMNCARLNCSHAGPGDLERRAQAVRQAAQAVGRPVALLCDLQGPKIRLDGSVAQRRVVKDEVVHFSGPVENPDPQLLQVAFPGFLDLVSTRSEIIIGDGMPRFVVDGYDNGHLIARAITPGEIGPRKGVTVTYTRIHQPAITAKDERDLITSTEIDADFVALSFVRSASDILELRTRLAELGSRARIIAKIEKVEAYENLDEIISVTDGIMVARGDYGVEAGIARVPLMQKETIRQTTKQGKLVITATQMLESMITAPAPTRAEAADVANAVLDGTSAVMLSAETASGNYPLEAVQQMDEISRAAEETESIYCVDHEKEAENADEAVMHAAVALGRDTDAAALVVPTTSGGTARTCAKWRPHRPIIALCHDDKVAQQLALEWGIYPTAMELTDSTDELIELALERAREAGGLTSGDLVVLSAGPAVGRSGATNLISLRYIP